MIKYIYNHLDVKLKFIYVLNFDIF